MNLEIQEEVEFNVFGSEDYELEEPESTPIPVDPHWNEFEYVAASHNRVLSLDGNWHNVERPSVFGIDARAVLFKFSCEHNLTDRERNSLCHLVMRGKFPLPAELECIRGQYLDHTSDRAPNGSELFVKLTGVGKAIERVPVPHMTVRELNMLDISKVTAIRTKSDGVWTALWELPDGRKVLCSQFMRFVEEETPVELLVGDSCCELSINSKRNPYRVPSSLIDCAEVVALIGGVEFKFKNRPTYTLQVVDRYLVSANGTRVRPAPFFLPAGRLVDVSDLDDSISVRCDRLFASTDPQIAAVRSSASAHDLLSLFEEVPPVPTPLFPTIEGTGKGPLSHELISCIVGDGIALRELMSEIEKRINGTYLVADVYEALSTLGAHYSGEMVFVPKKSTRSPRLRTVPECEISVSANGHAVPREAIRDSTVTRIRAVAAMVVTKEGEVAITRPPDATRSDLFMAGGVTYGETWTRAFIREMSEEVDLDNSPSFNWKFYYVEAIHANIFLGVSVISSRQKEKIKTGELRKIEWIDIYSKKLRGILRDDARVVLVKYRNETLKDCPTWENGAWKSEACPSEVREPPSYGACQAPLPSEREPPDLWTAVPDATEDFYGDPHS